MEPHTYYVIDTRTNSIVNAITTTVHGKPEDARRLLLRTFEHPEHLRLDDNPPRAMLERYRYWNERP